MLALNNVSVQCEDNQIVGVFGANSAGKSTLMYAISGIIEDIKRKEKMAGGERITIVGKIIYDGGGDYSPQAQQEGKNANYLMP